MSCIQNILERLRETHNLYEMANLTPKRTGLKVQIWSDHGGVLRNKKDHKPRVKIGTNDGKSVSVSIEPTPVLLAVSSSLKKDPEGSPSWKGIKDGITYVGEYYDLFLKHYMDTSDDFDDDDLRDALVKRGAYKY